MQPPVFDGNRQLVPSHAMMFSGGFRPWEGAHSRSPLEGLLERYEILFRSGYPLEKKEYLDVLRRRDISGTLKLCACTCLFHRYNAPLEPNGFIFQALDSIPPKDLTGFFDFAETRCREKNLIGPTHFLPSCPRESQPVLIEWFLNKGYEFKNWGFLIGKIEDLPEILKWVMTKWPKLFYYSHFDFHAAVKELNLPLVDFLTEIKCPVGITALEFHLTQRKGMGSILPNRKDVIAVAKSLLDNPSIVVTRTDATILNQKCYDDPWVYEFVSKHPKVAQVLKEIQNSKSRPPSASGVWMQRAGPRGQDEKGEIQRNSLLYPPSTSRTHPGTYWTPDIGYFQRQTLGIGQISETATAPKSYTSRELFEIMAPHGLSQAGGCFPPMPEVGLGVSAPEQKGEEKVNGTRKERKNESCLSQWEEERQKKFKDKQNSRFNGPCQEYQKKGRCSIPGCNRYHGPIEDTCKIKVCPTKGCKLGPERCPNKHLPEKEQGVIKELKSLIESGTPISLSREEELLEKLVHCPWVNALPCARGSETLVLDSHRRIETAQEGKELKEFFLKRAECRKCGSVKDLRFMVRNKTPVAEDGSHPTKPYSGWPSFFCCIRHMQMENGGRTPVFWFREVNVEKL